LTGGDSKDILVAGASGAFGGAIGYGAAKLCPQQNSFLVAGLSGFFTSAGFETIYQAIDPSKNLHWSDVVLAGVGGFTGSLGVEGVIHIGRRLQQKP